MLIFSEERYVPTDINMMVLKGGSGQYYYIHRLLYDQAVIINDIYKDSVQDLVNILAGQPVPIRADIVRFIQEVPAPINILGAFLILVNDEITELADMIGAIHVMSGPLNLRNLLKYPHDMRASISFSLSITEEYQLAWDRFFLTAIPYTEDLYVPKTFVPNNGSLTAIANAESEEEDEDELSPEEAFLQNLMAGDLFDNDDEEEEDEDDIAPEPEVSTTVAEEPTPVTEPANTGSIEEVKSGLELLSAL